MITHRESDHHIMMYAVVSTASDPDFHVVSYESITDVCPAGAVHVYLDRAVADAKIASLSENPY